MILTLAEVEGLCDELADADESLKDILWRMYRVDIEYLDLEDWSEINMRIFRCKRCRVWFPVEDDWKNESCAHCSDVEKNVGLFPKS